MVKRPGSNILPARRLPSGSVIIGDFNPIVGSYRVSVTSQVAGVVLRVLGLLIGLAIIAFLWATVVAGALFLLMQTLQR